MNDDDVLEQLTAEARYHRQRYDLYRAKMYALRPSTQRRLRELQRASEAAETRLAAAKGTQGPGSTSHRGRAQVAMTHASCADFEPPADPRLIPPRQDRD